MIVNGVLNVGDVILYQRKKKIHEWEINKISPSGDYFEIENDDWSERWIPRRDVLEVMGSIQGEIKVEIIPEHHEVIESKFK